MLYGSPEMDALFSREAHLREILAFEAALARAEARAGLIPSAAADSIAAACRVELLHVDIIFRDAEKSATVAVPLVKALTALVDKSARGFVHWGATSQDAIDTALMLQMRAGLDLLLSDMLELGRECAHLAEEHRYTPMAGRTLLQQALPITFGLKAARWLGLVTRQVRRLRDLRANALVVQFGGAAGTLASLGNAGTIVVDLLAEELNLGVPDLPWHTERDRVVEIASAVGVVAGALSKIAGDITMLSQSEVGEVTEANEPGKGGSSAMPHKRNPVDVTLAVASSRLAVGTVPLILNAMQQEHERAAGGWQSEWESLPNLFRYTASALDHTLSSVTGLVVNAERMRANLDLLDGLMLAESLTVDLAPELGRDEAYQTVQSTVEGSVARGISLHQAAIEDNRIRSILSVDAITRALDPIQYLGSTDTFIDRALSGFRDL